MLRTGWLLRYKCMVNWRAPVSPDARTESSEFLSLLSPPITGSERLSWKTTTLTP